MQLLIVLLIAASLAFIPATIANNKGREFFPWWFLGFLLFIVALPLSLALKPDEESIEFERARRGMAKCRYCAEYIKGEAVVCRFCGRDQPANEIDALYPALTVTQAAEHVGYSTAKVQGMLDAGGFPHAFYEEDGQVLIPVVDLETGGGD
ncbi:MAG: helix-turn-helix domain-containing protein [Actinomycetota bacterium]